MGARARETHHRSMPPAVAVGFAGASPTLLLAPEEIGAGSRPDRASSPPAQLPIHGPSRVWRPGRGGGPEGEAGDLGGAAVADRVLAADPLADVEQRRGRRGRSPGRSGGCSGWASGSGRGPGRRIWPPWLWPARTRSTPFEAGPGELVGGVAQEDPEVGLGHRVVVERRAPGGGGPAEGQGRAVDLESRPSGLRGRRTRPAGGPGGPGRGGAGGRGCPGSRTGPSRPRSLREDRLDPVDRRQVVEQVAGEGDEVGVPPRRPRRRRPRRTRGGSSARSGGR